MNKEAYFKHKDMMEAFYKLDKESIWVKSDKWRLIHRPSFNCSTTIYALDDDYSDIRKAFIDKIPVAGIYDKIVPPVCNPEYCKFVYPAKNYSVVEDFNPWTPADGEEAWYIDPTDGSDWLVKSDLNWSKSLDVNVYLTGLGLVFKTKVEANAKVAYMKAKYRVEEEIARLNAGWKPDFGISDLYNYYIELQEDCLAIDGVYTHKAQDTSMYIKSIQKAKQLLESHKEDLLTILEY